jgi:hypothetical protein
MRALFATPLLVIAGACAGTTPGTEAPTRDRNRISLEEIDASDRLNAYELIRALRPAWLRARDAGAPLTVYMNGGRVGAGPPTLRSISRSTIEEIRYYDSRAATTRFGAGHSGGVVDVRTRGR